jgi:hypothetical protein
MSDENDSRPHPPPQIGPFVPSLPFEGSIADTAALEAWIADVAARRG